MAEPTLQELQQAVQDAAQQAQQANQTAQQAAQSINEAIQKFTQTTGATTVSGREELGDIGGTEQTEKQVIENADLMFTNKKRTYDEYQEAGLDTIKRNQRVVEQAQTQLQNTLTAINSVTLQVLQNAAENANAMAKQMIRHSDIAIDRQWNIDEQGYTAEQVLKSLDPNAMLAVVAKILADMTTAKKTTEATAKTA